MIRPNPIVGTSVRSLKGPWDAAIAAIKHPSPGDQRFFGGGTTWAASGA
jgi:hypothetical protein